MARTCKSVDATFSGTIQMKTTEQCFHVATFESLGNTILTKATEQYFPVVLFIVLYVYTMDRTFESADKTLKHDHRNKVH